MRKKYQKKIIEKCTEAITFARVSSEKQERGASIDAQKEDRKSTRVNSSHRD